MTRSTIGALCALCLSWAAPPSVAATLMLDRVTLPSRFGPTVDSAPVPGRPGAMLILNQATGRILLFDAATGTASVVLDKVTVDGRDLPTGYNRGAYSLALAPDFAASGQVYVSVATTLPAEAGDGTRVRNANVVVRYDVDLATLTADPSTQARIVTIPHPLAPRTGTHYGGAIGFDATGALLLTTGDTDAPFGDGQANPARDVTSLLGKIIRIDPTGDDSPDDPLNAYRIPPDNPDLGPGADPALFAIGLRNPFKGKVDLATGAFFVADVGEARVEEIDLVRPGDDLGWPALEGGDPVAGASNPGGRQTPPVFTYGHDMGVSVVGGIVYHGRRNPALDGRYLFGDLVGVAGANRMPLFSMAFDLLAGTVERPVRYDLSVRSGTLNALFGFGQTTDGRLFAFDGDGDVFRVSSVPVPAAALPALAVWGLVLCWKGRRRRQAAHRVTVV